MPKNLRTFIGDVRRELPGEPVTISREVDPKFEATAVLRKLELEGRSPLAVFMRPKALGGGASKHPLVFNVFSTRKKICIALGIDIADSRMGLSLELAKRYSVRIPPVVIGAGEAPVKEVVEKGKACGFGRFPVPTHHAHDGGAYILGASVITKDPDSGHQNLAMVRIQIKDGRRAVVHTERHHHTAMIIKKYGERGQKAPIAIVIGHHPGFYLGSQWEGVFGTKEYELCGAALGEPLRLVPSETWGDDFLVPADAEIILEAEADWNAMDGEGPVGEYTRHYKNVRGGVVRRNMDPSVELLATTMRHDAHYQSLFIAHDEHLLIASIPKEAVLYEKIRAVCPGLKQVHLPPSGCGRHICYISLEQRANGDARAAILAALNTERYVKYVVAVDADVDVFSEAEVLWAVSTRTQPDKDAFVLSGLAGSPVDPSIGEDGLAAKMGIDATRPFGQDFCEVAEVPRDLLDSIRLEDYIS